MKKPIDCKKILNSYRDGLSQNQIAEQEHMSKTSVNKVLKAVRQSGFTEERLIGMPEDEIYLFFFPEKKRADQMSAWPDYKSIHEWLGTPGTSMKALWTEYAEMAEMSGRRHICYSEFCRKYAEYVKENHLVNHLHRNMMGFCQIGWLNCDVRNKREKKIHIFFGMMLYSGEIYLEATYKRDKEDEDTFFHCLNHMLEAFGRIPDIIRCSEKKNEGKRKDFCDYYHIRCVSHDSTTLKDQLNKKIEELLYQYHSYSVAECNRILTEYTANENAAHAEAIAAENQQMRPLPDKLYRVISLQDNLKAAQNCHIKFRENYYSYPYGYRGKDASVIYSDKEMQIVIDHKSVASHELFPQDCMNRYATVPEHMPPAGKKTKMDKAWYLRVAGNIGKETYAVIEDVFSCVEYEEQAYVSAFSILGLKAKYSAKRLEAACGEALCSTKHPRYSIIEACMK